MGTSICSMCHHFFFSLPSSEHLAANTKRTLYNILPHGSRKQFLPGPTRLCTLACTYTPMRTQIYIPRAPQGCRTAHLPVFLGTYTPLANAVCMPVPKLKWSVCPSDFNGGNHQFTSMKKLMCLLYSWITQHKSIPIIYKNLSGLK